MAASRPFLKNVKKTEMKTGYHAVGEILRKIFLEQKREQEADRKFKETVVEELEQLRAGEPDYDTGYQYVTIGKTYDIEHNIGQIPSRASFFFCEVQEPEEGKDDIFIATARIDQVFNVSAVYTGFVIKHTTSNKSVIVTATNNIFTPVSGTYWTEGYLRSMFWR